MKKIIVFTICAALMLTTFTGATFAANDIGVFKVKNTKYDLRAVESKTISQNPSNSGFFTILESITVSSEVDCQSPMWPGDPKAIATSDASEMEDLIYAKVRLYNGDDSLIDSDENSENNSSFVSATVEPTGYYGNDYAYGNHRYEKAGYETIVHETYDDIWD